MILKKGKLESEPILGFYYCAFEQKSDILDILI